MQIQENAHCRLDSIAQVLGREAVERIVGEVRNECHRRMGDQHWNIFENGTAEDWERIQDETHAAIKKTPSAPSYAAYHLAKEAATVFPDLPAQELAAALRVAANYIESCSVRIEPCDHDWQIDPGGYVWKYDLHKSIAVLQRCAKCRAMRQHEIYSDDPDFAEAVELAKQNLPAVLWALDE